MKYILIIFAFILLSLQVDGQKRISSYISENTAQIASIDPGNTSTTDLDAIGGAIGNARIVMLGEQDHGDAATFMAKARLVRYLYEKMGFTVLAFESDFFGLNAAYEKTLQGSLSLDDCLKQNILPIWTGCNQFSPMADYLGSVHQSQNKLHVAGIDNQLTGQYSIAQFKDQLNHFLISSAIAYTRSKDYPVFLSLVDTVIFYSSQQKRADDSGFFMKLAAMTDTIAGQLKSSDSKDRFWSAAFDNFHSVCRDQLLRRSNVYADIFIERDNQMARNLTWLVKEKYPKEKIIVWAANGHISRNAMVTEPKSYRHLSLGYFFTSQSEFRDQTYIIGFTSHEGETKRTTMKDGYRIPTPEQQSIETWINKKGYQFAFVDLKPFNVRNQGFNREFYMSGESHQQQKGLWNLSFDGIFYIKEMFACDTEN